MSNGKKFVKTDDFRFLKTTDGTFLQQKWVHSPDGEVYLPNPEEKWKSVPVVEEYIQYGDVDISDLDLSKAELEPKETITKENFGEKLVESAKEAVQHAKGETELKSETIETPKKSTKKKATKKKATKKKPVKDGA